MKLLRFLLTVLALAALYMMGVVQVIWGNLRAALVAIEYLTR